MKRFHFGNGALTCEEPIEGITQDLMAIDLCSEVNIGFYGGRFFIAESLNRKTAAVFVRAFDGILIDLDMPKLLTYTKLEGMDEGRSCSTHEKH